MGTTSHTVLLVDADEAGVAAVAEGLRSADFGTRCVGDSRTAAAAFLDDAPDLVVLELVLPDQSGLDLCRWIRERSAVPILVLTSVDSEMDIAVALEVGADDYVVKPVALRELLARTRGLLRRAEERRRRQSATSVIQVGDLRLDRGGHTVWVGDRRVELTLKEYALLRILIERAGRIVPRRTVVQEVWGPGPPESRSATLDAHMKRLRAKLEGGGAAAGRITTFRKLGYRYETEGPR